MLDRPSIVLELQQLAADGQSSIGDLLRKSLIVATKLDLTEFKTWIKSELDGYGPDGKDLPGYRIITGQIIATHVNGYPGHLQMPSTEFEKALSTVWLRQSVAQIAELAAKPQLEVTMAADAVNALHRFYANNEFVPTIRIPPATLVGVLDKVRNVILEWALQLEVEGIRGEGMTFSDDEKAKATHSHNISIGSIGSFTGALGGNVSAHNLQMGGFSAINDELKTAGIPQDERNELENIMDEMKTASPEKKQTLLARATAWVNKNKAPLGTIAVNLMAWFSEHHEHKQ